MTKGVDETRSELVIANRIIGHEDIADAMGHVSVRHPARPDRFLMSWSRSPELVSKDDIIELDLEGNTVGGESRPPYRERFIHAAIYEHRPDVTAVLHAHTEEFLPFSVTGEPLRPLITSASSMGADIPIWDIAHNFGPDTSMLVENIEQGRDLARCLGANSLALMAGHGIAAASDSLLELLRIVIFARRNAWVQMEAMRFGRKIRFLSRGEIDARKGGYFSTDSHGYYRAWEYWARRAGCADLLPERDPATMRTF